jgi:hypothetical protein
MTTRAIFNLSAAGPLVVSRVRLSSVQFSLDQLSNHYFVGGDTQKKIQRKSTDFQHAAARRV